MTEDRPSRLDPWARLRAATPARIGLGRAGDGLPTRAMLDFQLAHAKARDAVHAPFEPDRIAAGLNGLETVRVRSMAADRTTYLQRPDLGRRLDPDSAASLPPGPFDAVFVVADGLSATAVHAHAAPVLRAVLDRLPGWRMGPVVLASQARVALGDDVGQRMNATLLTMLIGERPGLSAADSLGVYVTYGPKAGRLDGERNCISNIRPPDGLSHAAAADKLAWLLTEARARRLTGVGLKDDGPVLGGA